MDNSERILKWLRLRKLEAYCDDCLSEELGIYPRQQINIICRNLSRKGLIRRFKYYCNICGKLKLVNSLSEKLALQSRRAVFETDEEKDTLNALKMFKYFYFNIETDQYFYKWAIIALHNALQGFMVLALRGTNGVNVYNVNSDI